MLTSLALLAGELVLATSGAHELGLSTSLALLAGELVLATETETRFPLETGIRFPLGLEMNTRVPLETGIRFPLGLETNIRFPLVLNVLVLGALLSAPFVLSPTDSDMEFSMKESNSNGFKIVHKTNPAQVVDRVSRQCAF